MNRTKLTYTPTKRKSVDAVDTICFMAIGLGLMLASILGILMPTESTAPWLVIMVGITGLITFWLPVIVASLED